ncbi:MAG: tetratricopeptide repeat protein, partial [Gammaproteobacteria bacterium]|nr:tetratricopeptide repeat protein [Gammaproteobacteria bacterium]
HPNVARDLNNLALLLQATNRLEEAEPLSRRMVGIFLLFTMRTGHEHPHLNTVLVNYKGLLAAMGREEEEQRVEIESLIESVKSRVGP